eukprot:GFYU01019705.1.p2 GENE.GFYU01019705.1~~GFYU01019705.1.p2  ORF type:complete len:123 (+),score=14.15 GFYU01019705.1:2-370(+)
MTAEAFMAGFIGPRGLGALRQVTFGRVMLTSSAEGLRLPRRWANVCVLWSVIVFFVVHLGWYGSVGGGKVSAGSLLLPIMVGVISYVVSWMADTSSRTQYLASGDAHPKATYKETNVRVRLE